MTTKPYETSEGSPPINPVERLATLVGDDLQAVDRVIHSRMTSQTTLIPQVTAHLVDFGGKRLRPLITLTTARQYGYGGKEHLKLAAAVEFIHTATLLHDDVVDGSGMRRGRPAANMIWGNKPSILVGDFLFSRAFQLMVETGSTAVLAVLANASAVIAEGEVMQLLSSKNLAISEADYLKVIMRQDRRAVRGRRRSRRADRRRRRSARAGRCAPMAAISASRSSSSTMRSIIRGARR